MNCTYSIPKKSVINFVTRYYSSDDIWEDFSIDNDLEVEEIFDVPHCEQANAAPKDCLYVCKNNKQTSLCPICSVKVNLFMSRYLVLILQHNSYLPGF